VATGKASWQGGLVTPTRYKVTGAQRRSKPWGDSCACAGRAEAVLTGASSSQRVAGWHAGKSSCWRAGQAAETGHTQVFHERKVLFLSACRPLADAR